MSKNFETDPDNRLLWRFNRHRLDVEAMRDSLLFVSGKLDQRAGGPPRNIPARKITDFPRFIPM